MTATTLGFVGCLNQPVPYYEAANGKGLSVSAFNEATGALNWLSDMADIRNPTYLPVFPSAGCCTPRAKCAASPKDCRF
ncbi:hypothetical protein [Paraburkholderia xenovorans]|uniref:hypothetical protein n=1 Tax=Paraburkholderia xenovorans TaxID=36873 RepID=UPI0038B981CF